MSFNILIVDDEERILKSVSRTLHKESWQIKCSTNPFDALEMLEDIDLMITDVKMPKMTGIELMHEARKRYPRLDIIIMTAFAKVSEAITAIREGVKAYLEKPFDPEELLKHCREIEKEKQLRLTASLSGRGKLVGVSSAMQKVYAEIDIAASSPAPLLITGETGSGKDLTAQAVHSLSVRARHPFVAVHVGAIPGNLIESELFGHEKGAFTGAATARKGRFSLADHGTLFLDEATTIPLQLQAKLLRAIETKEVWPVGAERPTTCDVRIIAATNTDIEALVASGDFREDLYYRLNVLRIEIPPLRSRPEDIPMIARTLLDRICAGAAPEVSGDALAYLISREWPGNVRELNNALERAYARAKASGVDRVRIGIESVSEAIPQDIQEMTFREARNWVADRWAIQAITSALNIESGNVTKASKRLKMNRTALIRTMKKLNIDKSQFGVAG